MDWTTQIDSYCERTDLSFWSEPVNAVTNAAFLIAAFILWRRVRGLGLPLANLLVVLLAVTGIGSALWHTFATAWSVAIDSSAILLFSLTYIFAANRDYWGFGAVAAAGLTLLYLPYAAGVGWVASRLPFFEISSVYWSLPLMIAAYGVWLRQRLPEVSRGLLIGAGILVLSLIFRSLDEIVCDAFALGTHFMWHVLNAVMLGWMIEVYRRHMLSDARPA